MRPSTGGAGRRLDGPASRRSGAEANSRSQLIAVTALAAACFTYPLLSLFDRPVRVLGVPLIWAYLFGVWALLIVVVAVVSRRAD